jgi:hypothetical protein
MRKIKYAIGVMLALSFSACTDWVEPAIPYNEFETGVYLRTLSSTPNFNFFAIPSAQFSLMVEAVDIEDGRRVREVDVFVARRRGPNVSPEAKVTTIPATAFQPHSIILPDVHPASGSKYPAATITIPVTQALQAMNMTPADINGGDFLEFRLVLFTTDGRTFTNSNLSGDISGGAFYRSPFFYRVPFVCPSNLAGEYNATTTGTSTDGCCPDETTLEGQTVTLTAKGGGVYEISDFTAGLYLEWYAVYGVTPGTNTRRDITDACGNISGTFSDVFSGSTIQVSGKVEDVEKGIITYTWENSFGDMATVTLTKK